MISNLPMPIQVCNRCAGEALAIVGADPLQRRRKNLVRQEHTMQVTIEGKDLVIRIPMQDPRPSASGKTLVVASTSGNKTTDVIIQGQPVIIGLNAYIKK